MSGQYFNRYSRSFFQQSFKFSSEDNYEASEMYPKSENKDLEKMTFLPLTGSMMHHLILTLLLFTINSGHDLFPAIRATPDRVSRLYAARVPS